MIIGFSERRSTVSEGNAASGEEYISVPIGMATLRTAEREHPMNIRFQVSSSTAFVEPIGQVDNLLYDATFGTRDRSNAPIEVFFHSLEMTLELRMRNASQFEYCQLMSSAVVSCSLAMKMILVQLITSVKLKSVSKMMMVGFM